MIRVLVVLISLASVAYTQVLNKDLCPDVGVQEDFSPADYLGLWYEYASYPAVFQLGGKCTTAEYSARNDGKVGVLNKLINRFTGAEQSIEGYATLDADEPAQLTVYFPDTPEPTQSNYWVLSSDYENYSVVWSCRNIGKGSARFAWLLTRERHPSDEVVQAAHDVFDKNGISTKFLRKTTQTGCESELESDA